MLGAIDTRPRWHSFQTGGVEPDPLLGLPGRAPLPALPAPTPQPPATTQPPPPPAAIQTGQKQPFVDPLASFNHDQDLATETEGETGEKGVFNPQHTRPRSREGFLSGEPPEPKQYDTHPEFQKWADLTGLLPRIQQENPKQYKYYQDKVDKLQKKIEDQTNKGNENARKEWFQKEKTALKEADQNADVASLQVGDLDQQLNDQFTKSNLAYEQRKANGKTPDSRRLADQLQAGSPLVQMDEILRNQITRSILALNHKQTSIGPRDAADLMLAIGTPVPLGQKGYNEYSGKAAANYKPVGQDAAGNYMIQTEIGTFAIRPRDYANLKRARQTGYDEMVKRHKAYVQQRIESEKP